jgi:hypothetical protein
MTRGHEDTKDGGGRRASGRRREEREGERGRKSE